MSIFSFGNTIVYIDKFIKFINSIFFIFLILGLSFALIFSPVDYLQGDAVRIMYVHVPSSWISLSIFSLIALSTIFNFVFKIKNLFLIIRSLAPIGLLFTCLSIVTGSLWGKPTWGTLWAWDARLTSMIVLMLFYILFVLSLKFFKNQEKLPKILSAISILGIINIPIIKYSVDWWSTLHQPASIKLLGTSSIHPSMLAPLFLMLLVLLMYCAIIFLMKYKTEIIKIKKKNIGRL
tara:strand:+ start:1368 stop:2072 length:705 start_codon:yes stop_codon:yes gene_type:complete